MMNKSIIDSPKNSKKVNNQFAELIDQFDLFVPIFSKSYINTFFAVFLCLFILKEYINVNRSELLTYKTYTITNMYMYIHVSVSRSTM